ncbi:hypothetical protein FB451DRAFT_1261178 [Mycena latifolia]|nr:hypothetical protein FB451DRAFT_1261178 [Mycena latifolia]
MHRRPPSLHSDAEQADADPDPEDDADAEDPMLVLAAASPPSSMPAPSKPGHCARHSGALVWRGARCYSGGGGRGLVRRASPSRPPSFPCPSAPHFYFQYPVHRPGSRAAAARAHTSAHTLRTGRYWVVWCEGVHLGRGSRSRRRISRSRNGLTDRTSQRQRPRRTAHAVPRAHLALPLPVHALHPTCSSRTPCRRPYPYRFTQCLKRILGQGPRTRTPLLPILIPISILIIVIRTLTMMKAPRPRPYYSCASAPVRSARSRRRICTRSRRRITTRGPCS